MVQFPDTISIYAARYQLITQTDGSRLGVVRPVLPLNGRYPTFGVCETQTDEPVSIKPNVSDYITQPDTDTGWWIF